MNAQAVVMVCLCINPNEVAKFTAQFNVNWKGVPTYVDQLSNVYDRRNNCAVRTYTMLFQYSLVC